MKTITRSFAGRTIFFLLVTVISFTCKINAQHTDSYYNTFGYKEYKLNNGLTVILNEDHRESKVFGVVITKAGGKNDPSDATGMAHYQEHMLFKGTQQLGTKNWEKEKPHIDKIFELYDLLGKTKDDAERKKIQQQINDESIKANEYVIPNEFSNIIKEMGGTMLNAGTGPDVTMFFNQFPPNQIEKWLEIYSHRFINPVFRSFQAELEVVYEEKNMYSDNFIMGLLEKFQFHFFKKHPYGQQTLIGTIDDLKNPSLTKMYDFFKTYYIASNMALILCGDFNTTEVIPMIEKTFGKLNIGNIPKVAEYKELPFNGRELVEVKLSPIKLGLLGFRTPPNGDEDEIALKVCNSILFNQNETGFLNKLQIDNKLLATAIISIPYNDYGATAFLIVPKVVGQSLNEAEALILNEIEKVKKGEFDDWMLEAAKNQLYKEYLLQMENLMQRAVLIARTFGENRSISEISTYPQKIKAITKEDIINTATKYYTGNYLAFFSTMGFPKKEKIEKPGFKPLVQKNTEKSEFAKYLDKIPASGYQLKFIDFDAECKIFELNKLVKFYYVPNMVNDIFSLKIKWGVGDYKMPMLKYVSQLMNYSGTKKYKIDEFKKEFAKLGCIYSISSNDSYFEIKLEGIEVNLGKSLALINELIKEPVLEQSKLNLLIEGEKANRKLEKSEPDNVAEALFEYIKYKKHSSYLSRMTINELKKINTDSIVSDFKKALTYKAEIHYTGITNAESVKAIVADNLDLKMSIVNSESPLIRPVEKYNENLIYLVHKKKAIQSKIYFFANASVFTKNMEPYIEAFNLYFGGDFSGLVLQEIREYRSMAYTAGARYSIPYIAGKPSDFVGYVGTQADKTIEAIEVFYSLIREMPEKPERIDMIRQYLQLTTITSKPDFRNLSESIEKWLWKGYTEDPAKMKYNTYSNLSFQDIVKFYKEHIKDKSIVIGIVGNKKLIDRKKLVTYGKIIEISEKDLFRD